LIFAVKQWSLQMKSKACILLVEDEGIIALDLKTRLSDMGYIIIGTASTGERAIQIASETTPDLILMDIKIKGPLDGIETAEKIRATMSVPIIFLTAFADEATLDRAKITGPSGYILKPYQERELAIAIEMALYKHKMDKALQESEERYMLAIQGANDGIWDWNLVKKEIYFSLRWKEIIGYQDEEIGSSFEDWLNLVYPDDRERLQQSIDHHLNGLTKHLECEIRMLHKDGSICWVLTRGLAVRDEFNIARRIAGSVTDITVLKRLQEQLVYDAYHDALTGIPNRALFLDRLEQAIERRKRDQKEVMAVIFLDLDQFKGINDTLGHQVGDQLLIEIASRMSKLVRASDTVARLGGDEFVVLLESAGSLSYACNVAERIKDVIKAPVQIEHQDVSITASLGIVMITDDHQKASHVLRDVDLAMYRAKSLGKDRFEVFHAAMSQQAVRRLEIETCLREALERKEFKIHFQPIYSFPNRQIVGLEALLRMHPPGKETISPAVFIPIAEEIGLIYDIGDWVLMESCKKMSEWHQRYPAEAHLNLHVNISLRQLLAANFLTRVQEIIAITRINPSRLRFEITENIFSENIKNISLILDQLALLGIQLLIDNFGSGYASLGYIRRFPITTVKLDRDFIFPVEGNGKNNEIIRAILILANELGLNIVAEGIETEEQAESLIQMKCHFGQGFLFSKPMEIQTLEDIFIRKFNEDT
jgi:diguanylate cyclase (GGDEF)-like protein/PAS domain S-box-containing protein